MNARKTLLLVAPAFPPSHGGGGLRIYRTYRRVCQLLPLDLVVVTEADRHYRPGWSSYEGFPVYAVHADGSALTLVKALPAFLRDGGMRRYAAMHIAGFSKAAQLIGLAGLAAGIPVIAEMTVDPDPPGHRLRDRIALLPIAKAKLLIVLNSTIREWFINVGAARQRIWQRPNPVDIKLFRPPSQEEKKAARAAFDLPDGTSVNVVFGRFQPRKNQRLAVQVLARLSRPHHLLLAGPAFAEDLDYLAAVRREAEELGVQDRVTIHAQTVADASAVYQAADQLWLTSTREGLPNVMLEALCCGVPVVVSRDLMLQEFITNNVNGRQTAADAASFAEAAVATQTLANSPAARGDIADRARQAFDADRLCAEFSRRLAAVMKISHGLLA